MFNDSQPHNQSSLYSVPHKQSTFAPFSDHHCPSSLSCRPGGARDQMKKVPSALFTKSANASKSADTHSIKKVNSHRPLLSSLSPKRILRRDKEMQQTLEPNKSKQGKARKGLAELLHWGNHTQAAQPRPDRSSKPIATPIALAHSSGSSPPPPAPPPKDDRMPYVLQKRPSNILTKRPSQAVIDATPSLRPPQMTPQSRARPSMGEDPFSRRGSGAEVIDSVSWHTVGSSVRASVRSSTRSDWSEAADKRESNASSKAITQRTVMENPDEDVFETPASPKHLSLPSSVRQTRNPAGAEQVENLIDVPARTTSLGKAYHAPTSTTRTSLPTVLPPSSYLLANKTNKKEKTRSKVWGIFGKKHAKPEAHKGRVPSPLPRNTFDHPSPSARQSIITPTDGFAIGPTKNKATAASGLIGPSIGIPAAVTVERPPRLPILHVQKPSTDITTLETCAKEPARAAPFSPRTEPISPVASQRTRMYESVVGSTPERPSIQGPVANIEAAISSKGLPKRKSLKGLFGLAIKKSFDRMVPKSSRHTLRDGHATARGAPPSSFRGNTIKSLAEEMETAENVPIRISRPSVPYHSRFGDTHILDSTPKADKRGQGDLQRVASATDKLSDLVACDFSPAPDTPCDGSSPLVPPSIASVDASPTPIRRVRSAVLTKKKSAASPLKAGNNISPLKLALHHAQAARTSKKRTPKSKKSQASIKETDENAPTSLVRKGMRNIFAPATPPRVAASAKSATTTTKTTVPHFESNVRAGEVPKQPRYAKDFDVPDDLKAIIGGKEGTIDRPSSDRATLGLPSIPQVGRKSPRRNNTFAPPKCSLPPVPDIPSQYRPVSQNDIPTYLPPRLTMNLVDEDSIGDSLFSGMLSPRGGNGDEHRDSFDFTGEYASLDFGAQRASFVEALASAQISLPIGPISRSSSLSKCDTSCERVSRMLQEAEASGQFDEDDENEDEDDDLELEIATAVVQRTPRPSRITPRKNIRKSPFQGQSSFQVAAAKFKNTPPKRDSEHSTKAVPRMPSSQPFNFISQPAAIERPAITRQARTRHTRMDDTGMSIASMSSLGSVIETGIAKDFTNYFELDFAAHLNTTGQDTSHGRTDSSVSDASRASRDVRGGRHHRRSSSIMSTDSISDELSNLSCDLANGPPVSMRNNRRSVYVSRYRRLESSDSISFGRSDWAAHRRNSSGASSSSNISFTRIGRPGLGDRMFQLDGGVQLTSIVGSPAHNLASPHPAPTSTPASRFEFQQYVSYDTLFDHGTADATYDSILDSAGDASRVDSLFASTTTKRDDSLFDIPAQPEAESIYGARSKTPFVDEQRANGYSASPLPKHPARSYEAQGEDESSMSLFVAGTFLTVVTLETDETLSGRQVLNASIRRPAKPRRRPVNRSLLPETPALSSPSTTATSSRLSIDTRFSSFSSDIGGLIGTHGHQRQKSSAQIDCQETIREEPSMATLRSVGVRSHAGATAIKSWNEQSEDAEETPETIRYWNQWKREADDEYKRMKAYGNSFQMDEEDLIRNNNDLAKFLAESAAMYKPLDQLPIGRRISHGRKSSRSESRTLSSPYGLPLPQAPLQSRETQDRPPQTKRMSLETKFERKQRSSTSSQLTIDGTRTVTPDMVAPSPSSALFARFTVPVPQTAPILRPTTRPFAFPFESFKRSNSDSPTMVITAKRENSTSASNRRRVDSVGRRAALGWGRRRNSDGPTKVEQMAKEYETSRSRVNRASGLPDDLQEVIAKQANTKVSARRDNVPILPTSSSRSSGPATKRPTAKGNNLADSAPTIMSPLPINEVIGKKASTSPRRAPLGPRSNGQMRSTNTATKSKGVSKGENGRPIAPMPIYEDQNQPLSTKRAKVSSRRILAGKTNKPVNMARQAPTPLRA